MTKCPQEADTDRKQVKEGGCGSTWLQFHYLGGRDRDRRIQSSKPALARQDPPEAGESARYNFLLSWTDCRDNYATL